MSRKTKLIQTFNAILATKNQMAFKATILSSYGVEHTNDLSERQLTDVIGRLNKTWNSTGNEKDKWRKMVMAVVGEYVRLHGYEESSDYIKRIASNGKADTFNKLTTDQLRGIYNAFKQQNKAFKDSLKTIKTTVENKVNLN